MARTDAALLLAARTDAGAFRELYERYADQLHGFHLRRTSDADAAYDLTAETFAQAWLSRARFRDEALAELPEGQRHAVALRFVGDLDYDGVADALGTSPQAARVRVHRALATLRQRLAKTTEAP